jgi:signal transduction histidine kinase
MAVVPAIVLIGAWAALGPLSGATARANLQRDLALAVSEAERTRLAGDLHDGPLQDLLLLARRLEALGDREGASLARDIADELREVSGDLRLPLLDDLGVGPALEWLATRIRRLTGMDVSTSWEAAGRPPAPVELAAFRIAQEAVTNAVRHGRPPIRVTYRSTTQDLFMAIEDAGARSTEAEVANPGRMRLGLLGMTQRAEQIGARLVVRQAATEGTVVAVEWQETAAT